MVSYYFVTAARTPGGTKFSPPYAHFDDALRGACLMLNNGAVAAWIVDRDGNLVLPAQHVKIRLKMPDQRAS